MAICKINVKLYFQMSGNNEYPNVITNAEQFPLCHGNFSHMPVIVKIYMAKMWLCDKIHLYSDEKNCNL